MSIERVFPSRPWGGAAILLCAIQVYEKINADSLEELTARFDWSAMRMYNLNAPGQNHGILLGTKGWKPDERAA